MTSVYEPNTGIGQAQPWPQAPALDRLDQRLVALLQQNGRASNRDLSRQTGVSEVTVANRIKRLVADEVIRIVAVPNPERLGFPLEVIIGMHVDVSKLRTIAETLRTLRRVRYVTIASGAYDVIIAALVRSNADLLDFLTQDVAPIPGVQKVETSHCLQVLKRNPDWSPFAAPGEPAADDAWAETTGGLRRE
jgi:Lrp/AsnC family transcriptional regulator for asnA, asnC and gidA